MRCFQLGVLLVSAISVTSAFAQAYPVKPVRIIVPIGPGSGPGARAKSAASEVPDLLGGRIEFAVDSHVVFAPLINSGKLKGLAIAGPRRIASLPGVPTLVEAGGPNLDLNVWQGVFAPVGTPLPIIGRLHSDIIKILNLPDIRNPIIDGGYEMGGESAEEFAAFVRADRALWSKVIKEVKVQPRG